MLCIILVNISLMGNNNCLLLIETTKESLHSHIDHRWFKK